MFKYSRTAVCEISSNAYKNNVTYVRNELKANYFGKIE